MKAKGSVVAFLFAALVFAAMSAAQEGILPAISFEQTVCDLDQVGLGTKNICEFKFTNTGQGPLKITAARKSIYIWSNDKANPNVRLTIKAEVVQIVQALPAKLNPSLREKKLGLNEITLHSLDNQPYL